MLKSLAFALFAVAAPFQDPGTGTIKGWIRSDRTGEPLPYAAVEVVGAAAPVVIYADSLGAYELRGLPPGPRLIRVNSVGHVALEVEVLVRAGRETTVDLVLAFEPIKLAPVVAHTGAVSPLSDTTAIPDAELGLVSLRSLEATPGVVELGLGDLSHALPPGQAPSDPSDVLYVRGSPADLKLVLLDGAPIYSPFHLGGLIQSFEVDALRAADLHLGGMPARYDGGLSYVLGMETRAGRRDGVHTSGGADLLSTRTLVEGPIGPNAGFLAVARAVHGQGVDWLLDDPFPYGYGDLLGRLDVDVGESGAVGVTGFWNRKSVLLSDARGGESAEWGNIAGSMRVQGTVAGHQLEATAAIGEYHALVPMGTGPQRLTAEGNVRRTRFALDLARTIRSARLQYGLTFDRNAYAYSARSLGSASDNVIFLETAAWGEAGGGYVDADWRLNTRLRLRGGLRVDLFSGDDVPRFAPRLSATWLVSDRAALTLAAGRYRQFVRGPVVSPDGGMTASIRVPQPLALASSSHFVLGLDQELNEGFRLGIEGYFKRFEGLPASEISGLETKYADVASGPLTANASGIDIWVRRGEGRVTGWLGYSMGWVWSAEGNQSPDFTGAFAGRHLLSAGLSGQIGSEGRLDLKLGYGSGIPFASLPSGPSTPNAAPELRSAPPRYSLIGAVDASTDAPPLNNSPDDPYLRLDLEVSHPWEPDWSGRRVTITPYFKVLNALDRRDAMFYRTDATESGKPRPLATLPLLPIIGVRWSF